MSSTLVFPISHRLRNNFEAIEHSSPCYIQEIPIDKMFNIFECLDFEKWGQLARVCRHWNVLTSDSYLWNKLDLKIIFPSLKIFDKKEWEDLTNFSSLSLDLTELPPLDKQDVLIKIKKLLNSKKVEKIALLTIPKGLTIYTLNEIFTSYDHPFDSAIVEKLQHLVVEKTYRVVITNILKESELSFVDTTGKRVEASVIKHHEKLLDQIECEMAELLPSFLSLMMDQPSPTPIFMRCREKIKDAYWIVRRDPFLGLICNKFVPDDSKIGIAAMYNFSIQAQEPKIQESKNWATFFRKFINF